MKTFKLLFLTLIIVLAACAPSVTPTIEGVSSKAETSAAVTPDMSGVSVLLFAVSQNNMGTYDSLIEAFETENPNIQVKTVSIEDTLNVQGFNREWPDNAYMVLASAADVIAATANPEATQQGALLDLDNFINSDPNLTTGSFYPQLLTSYEWNGGIWSIPTEASYGFIYYNKDLFDAAGIPYPQPGWTWDEFLDIAQALTVRQGEDVSQYGFVSTSFEPVAFIQSMAGLLFDISAYPPVAKINTTAVKNAVSWYTDLFLKNKVAPYYAPQTGGQPGPGMDFSGMQYIMEERVAMWYGTTGGMGNRMRMGEQEESNIGMLPFPISDANSNSTPAAVSGLSISSGTSKPELAWKWVSFLAQQQARQRGRFNMQGGTAVPSMPSVAAASGFWDNLDEETTAAVNYAIEHAYVDSYDGVGYDTFTEAVQAIMDGISDIDSLLAGAQAAIETEIEEAVAAAEESAGEKIVVSDDVEKAIQQGATVIQYGVSGMRFGMQTSRTLADQFQEANPGILVEIKEPQGFRGEMGLDTMATDYDCFQASPNFSSDEAMAAILNMEPFLSSDPTISKDDFFPSVLEQFTYQGQVWGLPADVTVNVMNYNKEMFDAANVPYPENEWTIDEFLDKAVALTMGEDENKQYGYAPSMSEVNDLIIMMDRLGASPYDDTQTPPRLVFNSPEVIEVVRWYAGLTTQYGVKPVYEQSEQGGPGGGFGGRQFFIEENNAAMWIGTGGMNFRRMGEQEMDTGIAPLPVGSNSANGSGFQTVTGYFISSQTEAREACWNWITFLTEQPNVASGLPGRISTAESDAYRQQVGADQAGAYLASINTGTQASFFQRLSDSGGWLYFSLNWFNQAYESILAGEATVEEAMETAQVKTDEFRSCVIANDAFNDMESIQSCASSVE
ncbi:MAG: extracellular solute-binding protein [Anaerolineales bacterium]|nr:extracellular solute-binding protein [Anaerolineales bacterium]